MTAAGTKALRRNGYRCQASTPVCVLRAVHAHHVLMRSHGGKDVPENLIAVCFPCHDFIHAHPSLSYENGWLVRGVR